MKTWTALILGALMALSINCTLTAQGGVVIETGPRAEVQKKAEKKAERRIEKRMLIRSADGGEQVIELKGNEPGMHVIDLGDGRHATISIQEDQAGGRKTQAFAIVTDEDDDDACEDCDATEECEADEDCEECELEVEGLMPIIGHIVENLDLETIAPILGAVMGGGDMKFDLEIHDGKATLNGREMNIADLLKHPGQAIWTGRGGQSPRMMTATIELNDEACECECECACCKAGKCATPKAAKAPTITWATPTQPGKTRVTRKLEAPVVRRRIATADRPQFFRFEGPEEGPRRRAIAITEGDEGRPGQAIIRRLTPPTPAQRAQPARPAQPDHRGQDLGEIENRIERLAAEMRALQAEMRALRRKI